MHIKICLGQCPTACIPTRPPWSSILNVFPTNNSPSCITFPAKFFPGYRNALPSTNLGSGVICCKTNTPLFQPHTVQISSNNFNFSLPHRHPGDDSKSTAYSNFQSLAWRSASQCRKACNFIRISTLLPKLQFWTSYIYSISHIHRPIRFFKRGWVQGKYSIASISL